MVLNEKKRSLVYIAGATVLVLIVALLFLKTWPRPEMNPGTVQQAGQVSKGKAASAQPQFVPPVRPHLNLQPTPQANPQAYPQSYNAPKPDEPLKQAMSQAKDAENSAENVSSSINPVGAALRPRSRATLPKRITISDLNFESGTATLTEDSSATLDQLASDLKTHPSATVRLEGYTDNTGSSKENKKLSLARAISIRNGLVNRGVNPDQLRTTGMSGANPVASNITQTGREENRRTDIVVVSR
jgi:outer membrane protein OmpA-like peptidoglycan-associated protein